MPNWGDLIFTLRLFLTLAVGFTGGTLISWIPDVHHTAKLIVAFGSVLVLFTIWAKTEVESDEPN